VYKKIFSPARDVPIYSLHSFARWSRQCPVFRLSLAASFLFFLVSAAPHQVHHNGGQIQALLDGSRGAALPDDSQHSGRAADREKDGRHQPLAPKNLCFLQLAGQLGWGCQAESPSLSGIGEWWISFFPDTFLFPYVPSPEPLSIRAPPILIS
jgi:hypothetical protein